MLEFFRNIFKKLKSTINQDKYVQEYSNLINVLRRVTPLELSDINKIHAILQGCVSDQRLLNRKMEILKEAFKNKFLIKKRYNLSIKDGLNQGSKRRIDNDRDVSYCINGQMIHGEVGSEEENLYFSREHVESLNSIPFKPKKCDFDCVVNECKFCMEKRLRAEIGKKLEAENEKLLNEKIKKRKRACDAITDLNEQFGIPRVFGMSVADECFDTEDLDSHEKEEFIKWKEHQKASAEIIRSSLDLKSGYATLNEHRQTLVPETNGAMPNTEGLNQNPFTTQPIQRSKLGGQVTSNTSREDVDNNTVLQNAFDGEKPPSLKVSAEPKFPNLFATRPSLEAKTFSEDVGAKRIIVEDENASEAAKTPLFPAVSHAIQNPFASEAAKNVQIPSISTSMEQFKNPFACTDVDKNAPPVGYAKDSTNQKPLSFEYTPSNPFSDTTKPSNSKITASPTITEISFAPKSAEASFILQPPTAAMSPFSTIAPGTASKNPFSGPLPTNPFSNIGSTASNSLGQTESLNQNSQANSVFSPFNLKDLGAGCTSGLGQQNAKNTSFVSNPFIAARPTDLPQPSGFVNNPFASKPSTISNPFEPKATPFLTGNPFKPAPGDSYLANSFTQGNPFSSENIFQNGTNQDEPGFFSSNDANADDGPRRKKAYRKR